MSTEHPDLVSYLRGELGNVAVLEASTHLEGCEACRRELLEVATGHALLAASARTLRRPVRTAASSRPGAAPSADSAAAEEPDGESEARDDTVPPVGLPAPAAPAPVPPPRWRRPLALAAAAVVLVAGAVVASPLVGGEDPADQGDQRAVLAPVVDPGAGDTGSGEVVMTGAAGAVQMQITTADLPRPGPGEYYYAWLLAPEQDKLLALGVVDPESGATFAVPPELVGEYDVVDISLEQDDGDPSHSLISVLRGDYDPGAVVA